MSKRTEAPSIKEIKKRGTIITRLFDLRHERGGDLGYCISANARLVNMIISRNFMMRHSYDLAHLVINQLLRPIVLLQQLHELHDI